MSENAPQWVAAASLVVAAVTLLATVSFGLLKIWNGRRDRLRNAKPIIRCQWTTGLGGHGVVIEIKNRLDEDLLVSEVRCKTRFVESNSGDKQNLGSVGNQVRVRAPIQKVRWQIAAGQSERFRLRIGDPSSPRWLRFTISSSAETLNHKRYVVVDNQTQ